MRNGPVLASATGGHELPGLLFERLRTVEADFGFHDGAFTVDPQRSRYAEPTVLALDSASVQEETMLEFAPVDESAYVRLVLIPHIDTEHDEALRLELFRKTTQVRSLRTAGRSPVRPEREKDWLAAAVGKPNLLTVKSGQREVWRRLVLQVSGKAALRAVTTG